MGNSTVKEVKNEERHNTPPRCRRRVVIHLPRETHDRDIVEGLGFSLKKRGRELGELDAYYLPYGFSLHPGRKWDDIVDPSGRTRYRLLHPNPEEVNSMSLSDLIGTIKLVVANEE